ncbi:MAG: META domain-containing protein [Actinomycetes bacterium]
MNKSRALITVILSAACLLTVACGNQSNDSNDPDDSTGGSGSAALNVDGRTFVGNTVTVNDKPYRLVPGSNLRISFEDGRIGASAGCNSMSGSATWSDGNLLVEGDALASTEMGCDPALMDQDAWFSEVLTSEPTLTQDGGTLTLASEKAVIQLVDEKAALPDQPLAGPLWQLESITSGDAVSSVPQGVAAGVMFTTEGAVRATLGCNIGHGTYTVEGSTLNLGPLGSTQKTCEPPASDVESAMLSVLRGDVTFGVDGDRLTLTPTKTTGDGPSELAFHSAVSGASSEG